jgi:hypothetical protein
MDNVPQILYLLSESETGQPRITVWWEIKRLDKEEQFASRKSSSEGQEEIKMATQATGSPTQGVGSPTQAADYTKSLVDCRIPVDRSL